MSSSVYDQQRVRRAFDRAAGQYDRFAVLQHEVCQRLLEKLDVVRLEPRWILDAGSGTGSAIPGLFQRYRRAQLVSLDLSEEMLKQAVRRGSLLRAPHPVCASIEQLPFADNSFELVFSSLSMQWCNDINIALKEALRVLKPGGLLVFTTFGPDTLKELRQSWAQVDAGEHVNRFLDMHDIGDFLLQDGFSQPVMEAERLTLTYDRVDDLMRDLKAIGANVTACDGKKKGLLGKSALQRVRDAYEAWRENGVLPASYEVVYGHAWKPEPEGPVAQHVHFDHNSPFGK